MEGIESLNAPGGPDDKGILINGINYSYSITKTENGQCLIKLFDPTENSDVYFTYEAPKSQLINEIIFLKMYDENDELDVMIESINDNFSEGNVQVEEKDGEFFLEFKITNIKKKCIILLTKHQVEQPRNELEIKIKKLEKEFRILLNQFEELKSKKENIIQNNDIKNIVKDMILDKDIKLKLFQELEQMLVSKYNLNNIPKNNNVQNEIINKIQNEVNIKEQNINNKIINIQEQLKQNIDYLNNINLNNNNNNYILLQVKIEEKDLKRSIKLFQQHLAYKYFYNFEKDDIEITIDDQIVPIKFKNTNCFFEYDDNSPNCELSQELEHKLNECYEFYWNFSNVGIYNIKILFKKKLNNCKYLFHNCLNIIKIDCSNFDCSQIIDCSCMFSECKNVVEINIGNLDFSLSDDFGNMFANCCNLEKIDISKLNTTNSRSFYYMFYNCKKLKELNVSNIKTTNCKNIMHMFQGCESLESIDMMNWDMKNIKNIKLLLNGCKSLKNIKINFNNEIASCDKKDEILDGLPEGGSFVWKRGVNCNKLLSLLPVSWNRMQE